MINLKVIKSQDLLLLWDLAKTIKAAYAAYFILEEDSIIVYGAPDFMISVLTRIVVENTTELRGVMTVVMKQTDGFTEFCKKLVPFMDIKLSDGMRLIDPISKESISLQPLTQQYFMEKKQKINDIVEAEGNTVFNVPLDTVKEIRDIVSGLRAESGSVFFTIAPGYIISVYSGMVPANKADNLSISVIAGDTWFLCKYEILKKKYNPIHVFVLYRRL